MITNFSIEDKIGKLKFFKEIFLMVNTKFEMILEILFLKINNVNMLFSENLLT